MHFLIFSSNDVYRHRTHNTQEIYLWITLWIPTMTHGRGDIPAWALVGLRVASVSSFGGCGGISVAVSLPMLLWGCFMSAVQTRSEVYWEGGWEKSPPVLANNSQCKDDCDSPIKISTFFSLMTFFFCLFFSIFPATAIILNNTSPSCYYQRQRLYSAMENYSEGTNHLT